MRVIAQLGIRGLPCEAVVGVGEELEVAVVGAGPDDGEELGVVAVGAGLDDGEELGMAEVFESVGGKSVVDAAE